jgi:hypothetical protein
MPSAFLTLVICGWVGSSPSVGTQVHLIPVKIPKMVIDLAFLPAMQHPGRTEPWAKEFEHFSSEPCV